MVEQEQKAVLKNVLSCHNVILFKTKECVVLSLYYIFINSIIIMNSPQLIMTCITNVSRPAV